MKSLYLSPEQWQEPFALDGPEAHHLRTVLRAGPGMAVRLFDGQGRVGTFVVQKTFRNTTHLKLVSQQHVPRPSPEIILALGWVKSSRRAWILEKAVELGAMGLIFWQAQRSQGRVPGQLKESWLTQVVNAAKQCGNPWLPTIATVPEGPGELMGMFTGNSGKFLFWEKVSQNNLFDPVELPVSGRTVLVLGPEGGLTEDEVRAFSDNGYLPRSLGRSTLRWETAALLCLGLCYWRFQGDGPEA